MKFLQLRIRNGKPYPYLREKSAKYGVEISDKSLSIKRPILISGEAGAGKTRELDKISEKAEEIWSRKGQPAKALRVDAIMPISMWLGKMKQEQLIEWAADAIIMIDNAHKLTGRKLNVALLLMENAKNYIITTTSIQALPTSLRLFVMKRDPHHIDLKTSASFDYTYVLILLGMLTAAITVGWEIAAILSMFGVLASQRGASKAS